MTRESMNLLEFQKRFPDEQACLGHLIKLRWPRGFRCPRCGHRGHSFIGSRRLYQCMSCRYQASVTAGTIFHKTRTPIHKWFWMIFMMTRQKSGVSILRMQKLLEIGSYKTAWLMGHKIRKGMEDWGALHRLAGLLETDGGFFGRRKNDSGTPDKKDPIRIAVGFERRGGAPTFLTVRPVKPESSPCLDKSERKEPFASRKSASDAQAHGSATNKGCKLRALLRGNPERNLVSLKWLYTVIGAIRGNLIGVHHGVSRKHLARYLSEFCYRFNRRFWDPELFNWAVSACLKTPTITYSDLIT